MKFNKKLVFLLSIGLFYFFPELALASVESTLSNVQDKLVSTILPLVAILGLVFAGFSFVMGSPSARSHLILAIIGAFVGFGSQSIVNFIRGLVN
ncbi:MAG: TrbC/VirB2 family protein [Bdellovibrionaceae bacterium]|nr:TrbC/VirB2 family protein [Pseudobdellovibrionaceae bacterium]